MQIRKLLSILFLVCIIQTSCQAQFSNLNFMKDSLNSVSKENIVYALGIGAGCMGLYFGWQIFGQRLKNALFQNTQLSILSEEIEEEDTLNNELREAKTELENYKQKLIVEQKETVKQKKINKELKREKQEQDEKYQLLIQQLKEKEEKLKITETNLNLLQAAGTKKWYENIPYDLDKKDKLLITALMGNYRENSLKQRNKLELSEIKNKKLIEEVSQLKKQLKNIQETERL